ncbi:MAG TPA: phenylalanine--tRNA ligase subunit beta [Longimicrobiaceae bacterium]
MNLSYRWLRSLAPTITDTPERLAERLGLLGAPVDELTRLGAELGDVVIARVSEVRQHPNADRLRLCTVHAGNGAPLQVVCGAPNVVAGGYYPFAPIGATLPGGVEIRKAKLRGESSEGMLCSARELGLGRDHAGLLALAGEWTPGENFVDALGLDDARLLIDVTANRPDLLSHLGVARELAPGGVDDIRMQPFGPAPAQLDLRQTGADGETAGVRITIEDDEGCPRYLAAVVRGVRIGPSPEWLATRLRAIGQRPINNVVDATNYVLHELGQPLHAFDLTRLGKRVVVRRARAGETLRTLDGVDRILDADMLVIADAERPVALAGVMGGEETEVGSSTTELLLECALFEPRRVRRGARALGLSTDASYRFERGVDPELQPVALRRLVDLILATAGGEVAAPAVDLGPRPHRAHEVTVRPDRVRRVLGADLDAAGVEALLRPIGFQVRNGEADLRVTVPGFRPDVTREIDVIEEIARRRGYDSFEETLRPFRPSNAPEDPLARVVGRVHELFARWGFREARVPGFAPEAEGRVPLLNPLSSEESHLRDALVPGLLRRVEHNWAHGVRDIRLYEVGTVFFPAGEREVPREEIRVAAVATGGRRPSHWSGASEPWDRWDLKALLAELGELLGAGDLVPAAGDAGSRLLDEADRFHASAAAAEGGRVRTDAIDAPLWAEAVWALEATLPTAPAERTVHYRPLPEHPAVERDLALLGARATSAAAMEEVLRGAGGELLEEVWPFDVYEGKGIPDGERSVAWRLRFRHADRTLTDAEVDRAIEAILTALRERLDVRRR